MLTINLLAAAAPDPVMDHTFPGFTMGNTVLRVLGQLLREVDTSRPQALFTRLTHIQANRSLWRSRGSELPPSYDVFYNNLTTPEV